MIGDTIFQLQNKNKENIDMNLQEQTNRIKQMMGLLIETDDDQEYIDYLLDKISKKGMSSLNHPEISKLKQLSQGETEDRTLRIIDGDMYIGDVSINRFNSPDYKKVLYPKSDDISDAYRTFFHEIKKLNIDSIEINNEIHKFRVIDEMSGEHISVDDIIITPFWEGQKGISIIKSDGEEQFIKLDKIPTTKNEMNEFIHNFFNVILPKII